MENKNIMFLEDQKQRCDCGCVCLSCVQLVLGLVCFQEENVLLKEKAAAVNHPQSFLL